MRWPGELLSQGETPLSLLGWICPCWIPPGFTVQPCEAQAKLRLQQQEVSVPLVPGFGAFSKQPIPASGMCVGAPLGILSSSASLGDGAAGCRLAQTVWMPQVRSSRHSYCCSLHTHTGLCFINSSKPHDIIELVPLWNDACTFWKHPHERLVCELHLGWLLYSLLSGIDNRGTHLLFFFVFSAFRQVPHSAYLSHIYGWMAVPLLDLFWDIGAHFLPTGKLAFNCFTTVTSCHSSQLKKKVALHWSRF